MTLCQQQFQTCSMAARLAASMCAASAFVNQGDCNNKLRCASERIIQTILHKPIL